MHWFILMFYLIDIIGRDYQGSFFQSIFDLTPPNVPFKLFCPSQSGHPHFFQLLRPKRSLLNFKLPRPIPTGIFLCPAPVYTFFYDFIKIMIDISVIMGPSKNYVTPRGGEGVDDFVTYRYVYLRERGGIL